MEAIVFETSSVASPSWLVQHFNTQAKIQPPIIADDSVALRHSKIIFLWRGKSKVWLVGAVLDPKHFAICLNEPVLLKVARSFAQEKGRRSFVIKD